MCSVQGEQGPTSGTAALDSLIDGVRVGDNLVIVLGEGVDGRWLVDRFARASSPDRLMVVDAVGDRDTPIDGGEVLAWGGAIPSPAEARRTLQAADRRVGRDAAFGFDSLSALATAWGDQLALDLFLWACPRLYRRGSIALWLVDRDRHDEGFLRRLTEITQVVVTVDPTDAGLRLEVVKADGRARSVQGRTMQARLVDGDLVDVRTGDVQRQRLATALRTLRVSRGVGQAELARRVGISPSALSQAERGVRGVSAETLTHIWEVLGVPFGPADPLGRGYRINRRSGQTARVVGPGARGRQLSDDPSATVWQLVIEPRAAGRSALFQVKATETITVLRGVLQLDLGGHTEALQEGDTIVADGVPITAWGNPSDIETEVLWLITR